jgi:hypothetical protein
MPSGSVLLDGINYLHIIIFTALIAAAFSARDTAETVTLPQKQNGATLR